MHDCERISDLELSEKGTNVINEIKAFNTANPQMLKLIVDKREAKTHSADDIHWLINNLDHIPDYQLSAWLMAVCLNGLDKNETAELTKCMAYSGHVLTLKRHAPEYDPENPDKAISNRGFVDKHSTGGVGDKVSLVLSPLLAAIGFKVSKFSGRSLGHTGGTVDKLEAIPGFRTDITMKHFEKQIEEVGVALAGQTLEFAPADKRMYSLRDRSGTVESTELIAASVMSKKIAGGADIIILDVKVGSGAFMKNVKEAEILAKAMKEIGDSLNLKTKALISDMNQPLGAAVGNALEVQEAIDMLEGKTVPEDFYEVVVELASTIADRKEVEDALKSGKAYVKFTEFIESQSGNLHDFKNSNQAKYKSEVYADQDAHVKELDAYKVGLYIHELGYTPKDDGSYDIDNSAGALFKAKVGDKVKAGDLLFSIQGSDETKLNTIKQKILEDAYLFSKSKVDTPKLIHKKLL